MSFQCQSRQCHLILVSLITQFSQQKLNEIFYLWKFTKILKLKLNIHGKIIKETKTKNERWIFVIISIKYMEIIDCKLKVPKISII